MRIKFFAILRLKGEQGKAELYTDIGVEGANYREHIRLRADRKCPDIMSKVIK